MAMNEATTTLLPLAHLLHWYFMPLYAAPILIVLYSTIRETIRQRRQSDGTSKRGRAVGRKRRR
jgi:hypothetical protein